jgi:hypothetical protein
MEGSRVSLQCKGSQKGCFPTVKTEASFVGFVSCFLFQIRLYRKSSETSPLQLILHEEDEEDENYTGLKLL